MTPTYTGQGEAEPNSQLRQKKGCFSPCSRLHDPAALGLVHIQQLEAAAGTAVSPLMLRWQEL